ncbi:DUF7800 domain-containing protein [Arthrobacter sp. PsM3]|uniref:DUF7800 domain-containing protein n=1 Tax=Arthrobacter sp. PsM3 TaxID=3030531 RepID=UPI00263ABA07|nr:hypothetical protein [Arthrobacter sp. PsM3]MDN4645722.1 hypothetical protein [Arthrobacter sp. PsM3]
MTTSAVVLGPMIRDVDWTSASIWVETRSAARVLVRDSRDWTARTFTVHGHHCALAELDGLVPGTVTPYALDVNGTRVWPDPESGFPASMIATLETGKPLRMASGGDVPWPDLVAFLGDQVYADLTSEQLQEFIRSRRDIEAPPGEGVERLRGVRPPVLPGLVRHREQVAAVRPAKRLDLRWPRHPRRLEYLAQLEEKMEATSWWHERIVAGLASYWVYQHLGNLSSQERAGDAIWQRITAHKGEDNEIDEGAALDNFADRADQDPGSYRWSHCRDFGDTRLIVVDSRAARDLTPDHRALVDKAEMAWVDTRMRGGFRHLLVATPLPFLLPMGLHYVESWNKAVSQGTRWSGVRARIWPAWRWRRMP